MSSNSNSAGSSCPVDHSNRASTCPVDHTPVEQPVCPMDHSTSLKAFLPPSSPQLDPHNQMPLVPEQTQSTTQTQQLSTSRTVSSIPRADRYEANSSCPAHEDASMWIYPSEQMFFNAMKRKSWNPHETDMKT
ncbi:Cytochrome c1 heme lyase, partial [Coemansia sp. S17]